MASKLEKAMLAAGFTVEFEKGHEFYRRLAPGGYEERVEGEEGDLPTRRAQEVSIGVFPLGFKHYADALEHREVDSSDYWGAGATFGEVADALDAPSASYSLVDRLGWDWK